MEDCELVHPTANIRDLEFVCVDAMGQYVVLDVTLGSEELGRCLPIGLVTIPLHIAKEQLSLILKAIEDTEAATPTIQ